MKRLAVILCCLAAALAVGLCVPPAQADCRTFVRSSRVVYHEPYVEKVVVKQDYVTPVAAIYLPLYSAVFAPQLYPGVAPTYGGGVAPAAAAPTAADPCADVRQKALLLEQRLQALERGQVLPPQSQPRTGVAPMPQADQPQQGVAPGGSGFVAFAGKNCASCHSEQTAATKGGRFVLVSQGKLAELSPEKTGEVIRRLSLPDGDPQAMPKGIRLTPQQKLEGIKAFVEN